jgi:uncharacterized protein (DUF433 family)
MLRSGAYAAGVIAARVKAWHYLAMKAALPIEVDPEIMSGVPVFAGTRVPVESLFDYLIEGSNLEEFLECFPTVKREDALSVLSYSKQEALHQVPA